jgi:hypothetical protein
MSLVDPLGRILVEIRDDPSVAALTTRIRGGEPAKDDALGPGSYQRFVVLVRLGAARLKRAPIQEVRILARCYGTTFADAAVLAGAVSDAIHAKGHRISAGGVVIFTSFDDIGTGAEKDPDTGQPHQDLIISVGALTELLPMA